MLLVIMTKSLIRLDNTVRASLNNDCMTNRHDDRRSRARTETDSDITRVMTRVMRVITRGYGRERKGVGERGSWRKRGS